MDRLVVGVVGGSGGVGGSTFAAALAAAAGRAVLVDLDPAGGGVDLLVGLEQQPGARWSDLHVDGGRIDPAQFGAGLPWWGRVAVLAADAAPPVEAVSPVLDAAAALGTVVLDLPRYDTRARSAALERCSRVLLVAAAEVRALAAAHAVAAGLPGGAGLVLRRGPIHGREAAAFVGLPLAATLPRRLRAPRTGPGRPRRPLLRAAAEALGRADG